MQELIRYLNEFTSYHIFGGFFFLCGPNILKKNKKEKTKKKWVWMFIKKSHEKE